VKVLCPRLRRSSPKPSLAHHADQKARRERLWKGLKAVGSVTLTVATNGLTLVAVGTAIVGFLGSKLMGLW
jgi:hypothetical protein